MPRYAAMLSSPNADQLIYGMRLMTETKALLPKHVGDVLVCNSCHLNGGTMEHAAPYVGIAALFPSYAPRAGKIIDFKDRVNGCMRRSMNGKPLDKDSKEMLAMIVYMDSMKGNSKEGEAIPGRGVGKIDKSIVPNVEQRQEDLQGSMCRLPWRQGRGDEAGGRQVCIPAAMGQPVLQHRRRYRKDLYRCCLRQEQHADIEYAEISRLGKAV